MGISLTNIYIRYELNLWTYFVSDVIYPTTVTKITMEFLNHHRGARIFSLPYVIKFYIQNLYSSIFIPIKAI